MKISKILFATTIVAGTTMMTGCLDKNGGFRSPRSEEGSNSVVASIEGISASDIGREGMKYTLACDGDVRVLGNPKEDKSAVEFSGDKIKNDMTCAMEIGISEEEGKKLEWDWFGVASGKSVVGLMYGSNKGKVAGRALQLTLYRLYSPRSAFSFSAELKVALEVADAAAMPADDKVAANLICSATEKYAGIYKKQDEKNANLTFPNLKIKDLTGKTCAKVALLIDNKEAFSGATVDVIFTNPEKDKVLSFPKEDARRYVLKATEIVGGNVDVGTIPGGICLKYENSDCLDRRIQDLGKWPKNYIVAKVMGLTKNGEGESVTFYVGAGASGFGLLEGTSLDVKAINKAVRSAAGSADRKAFSFYKSAISDDLLKAPFNADFVSGKAFESFAAEETDLDGVMLVHIDSVRLHGMHVVEAAVLNAQEKAHWLAVVKAKKDNDEKEFIATGVEKYFYSPAVPLTIDTKPVFLNIESLLADMAATSGSAKFRAYAIKGSIMALDTCKAEKSLYLAGMSTRHLGNLKPESGADAELDACDIEPTKFGAAVGTGYTFTATLYKFGWLEVTK